LAHHPQQELLLISILIGTAPPQQELAFGSVAEVSGTQQLEMIFVLQTPVSGNSKCTSFAPSKSPVIYATIDLTCYY
jgi:hypothetical protein